MRHSTEELERLLSYAAPGQAEKIKAVIKHEGNTSKAGEELGVSMQAVNFGIKGARLRMQNKETNQPANSGDKWLVIPDMQIKPGIDMTFVRCIGEYILKKRPDGVINLGDMADMESLSSYDKGKRSFEGRRYKNDVECVITAQKILWEPINRYNDSVSEKRRYNPRKVFLAGNHEERGDRVTQVDPMLDGTIDIMKDLKLSEYWDEVHEFMKVVVINGVAFSHYFGSGVMNRACGTAQQQLTKMHMSCISGHQPGRQTSTGRAADGRLITSIIAGSSYDYDLDYMGVQGNKHWRGVIMLHNMRNGEFDEVYVPIEYLKNKYANGAPPIYFAPEEKK